MSALASAQPKWHSRVLRWQPYFPGPLGRCVQLFCDRRHHVFTLNASRNRHSMAPLAENRPCPKKRNGQSTWGLPRHMGGVRESARCPYGAAEPSWAMVRCYSSSHPPIQYTACVGLSHIFQKVTLKEKNHPPGSALEPISQAAPPRTTPMATILPRPSREM